MTNLMVLAGLLTLALLAACHRGALMPTSGGRAYEVLVTGSEQHTVDSLAALLRAEPAEGLPQQEPAFDVSAVVADGLSQNTRYVRNIVMVDAQCQGCRSPRVRVESNVYAQPQTVVYVEAATADALLRDMPQLGKDVVAELLRAEMNSAIAYLGEHHNEAALMLADSCFGCRIWLPEDLTKVSRGRSFMWACNDGPTTLQAVCIYRLPADAIMPMRLIDMRDSILSANISCEPPGATIAAVRQSVTMRRQPGDSLPTVIGLRGLWQTEGAAMGGPFVCLAQQAGDSVTVVDAFVYAPGDKKRNLMRRLEAALYTLKTH